MQNQNLKLGSSTVPVHLKSVAKFALAFCLALLPTNSFAWDKHYVLMPLILNGAPPELKPFLDRSGRVPCESEDLSTLQTLIQQLDLNPSSKLPRTIDRSCEPTSQVSVAEVLTTAVDDPDHGIDKDLPVTPDNRYDPNGDRKWMGGTVGPSSQGFRHMYFGGWKLSHPISTFQIPTHAIGQAPRRFEVMARRSKEFIKAGNIVWGARTLGWAMHYVQDITQPFHSVQAVTMKMVPWYELLAWPPQKGFDQLVKETTRIITNYHWAYEGYVREAVKKGEKSPFFECLTQPEKYSKFNFNPLSENPVSLIHEVAQTSIELAPEVGRAEIEFFGPLLLQPGVDFTKNLDLIDNEAQATRPDLEKPRARLHEVTCKALANSALASRLLIQWAFQAK